jgi:hypothetical protein
MLHHRYRDQRVNAVWGKQSQFTVRTVRNTQIHCVGSPNLTGDTQIHCVGGMRSFDVLKGRGTLNEKIRNFPFQNPNCLLTVLCDTDC